MERRSERLKSPTPERRRRALTVRPSRLANGLDELATRRSYRVSRAAGNSRGTSECRVASMLLRIAPLGERDWFAVLREGDTEVSRQPGRETVSRAE
jgi:hypothetical protein